MCARRIMLGVLAVGLIVGAASDARAADAMAQDNATVMPTGPRSGDNGKIFFNVEGRPSMANASYGVLEFNSNDLQLFGVSEVDSVTVTLVQSLASFTSRGQMDFFVTDDTTTSLQADDSPLIFDPTDINGLNGQLSDLFPIGTGVFLPIRTGWADRFTFTIDPGSAAETYLVNQINSGGLIRIVVAPEANALDGELVGATYAGAFNANLNFVPLLTVVGQ